MTHAPTRLVLLLAFALSADLAPAAEPKRPARLDSFGDALPSGAAARLGTVRFRHGDGVCAVAFAPDGRFLASISRDRTVRLWNPDTGKEVRRFKEPDCEFYALAFAPDGKTLAASAADPIKGGNAAVRLWDVRTGKEVRRFEGHQQPAHTLAFAADGTALYSVSSGDAIRWDARTGQEQAHWKMPGPTASLAVAPDLDALVFAGSDTEDRAVHVWDATGGKEVRHLRGHQRGVTTVALSADGRLVASANSFEAIRLWDRRTGKLVRQFDMPAGGPALAFAPDGKRLAAACGQTGLVRVWDTATGKVVGSLRGYQGWVNGLAFAPDGKRLALAGADTQSVHLWDVATGKDLRPLRGHRGHVEAVAFAPDGRTLASAGGDRHEEDTAIRLWDAAGGEEVRRLEGHPGNVHALAFSPDGKLLASGGEKEDFVRLWDHTTGKCVRRLRRVPGKDERAAADHRVSALAFAPDGRALAAAVDEGHLVVFDTTTGAERCQLEGHESRVTCVAFSPDGKLLASGSLDRTARLWDLGTGKEVRRFGKHEDTVRAVAFAPAPLPGELDGPTRAAPRWLLAVGACDWEGVGLWEVASGREVGHIPIDQGRLHQVAFAPDGRSLAVGCGAGTVTVYEVATCKERRRLIGHTSGVRGVAFAPDGTALASGSADSTVLLWALAEPARVEAARLSRRQLEALWADLAGGDAARAERAVRALLAAPADTVPFLREHLRPGPTVSRERLTQLLRDLDHTRYQVRDRATTELERLGELAEPLLRGRQGEPASAEAQRRVHLLLRRLDTATLSPVTLRALRAFEVLERLGTDEARAVFEDHARAGAGARLGQEALSSLDRLSRRR